MDVFDWQMMAAYAGLVANSVRRHKVIALAVWACVVGASVGLLALLPKTYEVQTTLQARRNQVMAALSNPGRAVTLMEADAPTKQASETVFRHDNLVSLVKQTDLLNRWSLHRAPLLRLKDAIMFRVAKSASTEDQIEGFVGLLEQKLFVSTGDGTITIGILFPDPQLAFHLVETALQNFVEARHAVEITSISEAISLLEGRSAAGRDSVEASLRQLQNLRTARASKLGKRTKVPSVRLPRLPVAATSELLTQYQNKRRALVDIEEVRRRRASELETRLEEQRALLSETHPLILDIQQGIEKLRQPSSQLNDLRNEVRMLESEVKQRGFLTEDTGRGRQLSEDAAGLEPLDPREDEDPDIEYAKSRVRHEVSKYTALLDHIESAQLELDTARAAFRFRYTVLKPAQLPRSAIKPKPVMVIGASVIAGLVLAILATALMDLQSRRLFEAWQVERDLGVRLLGQIRQL